jgi:hypothetical protein
MYVMSAVDTAPVSSDNPLSQPSQLPFGLPPFGDITPEHLGANVCDGSSLDPLGELVDGHQQVGVSSRRPLEGTHKVEAPHRKRPSDGDHLQCLSREVGLLGVKLAPVA